MLESLKAMQAMASLMKNKDALRDAGERVRVRLSEMRIQGGAGNGAVRVVVSGELKVESVHIEPVAIASLSAADPASRAMLQDLIAQATNNALDLARDAAQREIAKQAEGMGLADLPGLDKLLAGMGGPAGAGLPGSGR